MTARHAASASDARRPRLRGRRLVRPGICLLAGVAVWAAFPPLNAWPLAMVGVAAFTLAVRDASLRGALGGGWLFGLGLFVPMLSFLRWIGYDAWLILAVGEALWFSLLAAAVRQVRRAPLWPLAVALLWVGEEWLRDRVPFHGFPWGRLAFGQADGPLLPWAAVGGAVLVTFVTALFGALLAVLAGQVGGATSTRRRRTAVVVIVVSLAVIAVGIGGAAAVPVPTGGTTAGGPSHVVVAVVQGNVPRLGLEEFAQRRAVTANHVAETQRLAADVSAGRVPRPDLVIWPENASDDDPFHDPVARSMIESAVQAVGVPVLVGAVLDGPGSHVRNAAIVWSPTSGPGQIYVKRHLVPFGEYIPGRGLLTHLGVGRFALIPRDFAAGSRPGVLDVGPVRVADVICFEVADDDIVRQAVTGGGRLLTVQTNNATYERVGDSGDGGETAQQLEMSRLRAVEHGRAVLVAATSGISAVIAPDGRVRQRSGVFAPALLVADVPLRDPRTVSDRLGMWPEHGLALAGLLWLVTSVVLQRRRRRDEPAGPVPDEAVLAGTS